MTREFKVGDKVKMSAVGKDNWVNRATNPHDGEGVITSIAEIWARVSWGNDKYNSYQVGEISHIEPVAIGYVGKLKDMDLQDGDVVSTDGHCITVIDQNIVARAFDFWTIDFTLVSRANDTQYTAWSKWLMSKECGTMGIKFDDVEKAKLAKCVQFAYRGRNLIKTKPVITTEQVEGHFDTDDNSFYGMPATENNEYDCTLTVTLEYGKPVSLVGKF